MKKITTVFFGLTILTSASFAQGIFFKAGAGYAIPMASQSIGEKYLYVEDYTDNNQISKATSENVSGSFGAGINFNVGAGFMFNEFIGVELNVQYTQGKKFETSEISTYTDNFSTSSQKEITETYSKGLYINPSFIITSARGSKIPYGRFGVIVGSPTISGESSDVGKVSYYPDLQDVRNRKWEYSKGISIGLQGAVGINWMLSDKIDLFTEVNFISMSYYAEEYNLTEDTYNGNDNLQDLSVSEKKIIFKKEIALVGESQDPDKPSEALREGSAFSSLSLQVGIRFLLNGHGM